MGEVSSRHGRQKIASAAPRKSPLERVNVPRKRKSMRDTGCPRNAMYLSGVSAMVPTAPDR